MICVAEIFGCCQRVFQTQRVVALVAPVHPGCVSPSAVVSRPNFFVFNLLATQTLFVKQESVWLMNKQVYPDEPENSPNKLSLWCGNLPRQLSFNESLRAFLSISPLILLQLYTAAFDSLSKMSICIALTPTLCRLPELLWLHWGSLSHRRSI